MRPRSTAGTAVGSRRSTGLVHGHQRSPYQSLGGGASPHQTGQMLSGQHPGEDFYEAEGEQDPLMSESRRNLWYRLPPPTRTARRPLPFSRAAATSPAPRQTGGITLSARRHFPAASSPSGAAGRRQQATPVIDVAAASQCRLDQMMEGCVMPASVSVFNSLLASRAARGASMPPGHSGVADGGWDVTPWSSGSRGRGSPQPGGRPSAGGIQWGSPTSPSTARGSPPNTGVSWLEGGGAPASAGATPATDTAQLRGEAGGVGTEEGASPLVAPWARAHAADLSARAQQGDLQAVEELGGMVRVGLPGLPAQPEVARGLLLLAADSGGPPVLGPVCIG